MEGKTFEFNLDVEFQEAAKEVQKTSEAYQQALGRFHYLQSVAQRLNPPQQESANELRN